MARSWTVSGVAGVLVAVAAFVVLQAWTPPMFVLKQLGASDGRHPTPEEPRHKLEIRSQTAPGPTPLATEADVVAARPTAAPPDGVAGVALELRPAARDRLAAHARSHPSDMLAIVVDGAVVTTRAASTVASTAMLDLAAAPPLSASANQIAARFGGAPIPVPSHLIQAARIVPALIAGFIVLALIALLTRR
jgi:hypothetical protein